MKLHAYQSDYIQEYTFIIGIGTEPVKEVPPKLDANSYVQSTQTLEHDMNNQQELPAHELSAEVDGENKGVQAPDTGSESQGSGRQENKENKDQIVTSSESDNDATEEKTTVHSVDYSDKQKKPDISVAKVEVEGDNKSGIEESVIEGTIESNKFSNKTAVIVLAMGLGITAILLMFVGCRLRNVKRRLRKGRPMNSNEADYLINGMYL